MEASLEVHLVWACPAQIVVVSALLVLFLGGDGGAVAAGVACLVAVLPLAKVLVRWMIRVRKRRMPVTDARVREVGEVLGGIRVSKLNGWEPLWDKRWKALRAVELGYTRLEMFVYGLSMLLMVTSPVVATIALFSAMRPSPKPRRVAPAVETTTPAVRRRERSFESVERTTAVPCRNWCSESVETATAVPRRNITRGPRGDARRRKTSPRRCTC